MLYAHTPRRKKDVLCISYAYVPPPKKKKQERERESMHICMLYMCGCVYGCIGVFELAGWLGWLTGVAGWLADW